MGCLGNSKTEDQRNEEKAQRENNKKINRQLQKDKQIYRATHRLLLLGGFCVIYRYCVCSQWDNLFAHLKKKGLQYFKFCKGEIQYDAADRSVSRHRGVTVSGHRPVCCALEWLWSRTKLWDDWPMDIIVEKQHMEALRPLDRPFACLSLSFHSEKTNPVQCACASPIGLNVFIFRHFQITYPCFNITLLWCNLILSDLFIYFFTNVCKVNDVIWLQLLPSPPARFGVTLKNQNSHPANPIGARRAN